MFQRYNISYKTAWLGSILVLFVVASGIIGYQLRTQDTVQVNTAVTPAVAETTLPEVVTVTPVVEVPPVMEALAPTEPEPMPEVETPAAIDVAAFLEGNHPVVYPLDGEVITVFSVSELTYNETLDDWRIHDGVDIAAQQGTVVVAACAGTVICATEDDLLGTMVVIDHNNGYQTTYANLQTTLSVDQGDVVSSGQLIGTVGTTALADSALSPHLHFSVSHNGDAVDPMVYLNGDAE